MSRVWLVRHGQAGTRKAYDSLSALGRRQARLLGEYLVQQGIHFSAAWRGEMVRQQHTAAEVSAVYREAGLAFPEIEIEPRWNEFDLDDIYKALAPQLAAEDPQFRAEYEEMVAQARAAADQPDAGVNRRWMPCDIKVFTAWLRASHSYDGESWDSFRTRVASNHAQLAGGQRDTDIVVFTSATPIGIFAARTMDVTDERVMKLAGAVHNASYTVVRVDADDCRLHTFNAVPHLRTPDLRTYR